MVFHTRAQITAAVVTVKRHFSHRSDQHRPRENKLRYNRHAAQKKHLMHAARQPSQPKTDSIHRLFADRRPSRRFRCPPRRATAPFHFYAGQQSSISINQTKDFAPLPCIEQRGEDYFIFRIEITHGENRAGQTEQYPVRLSRAVVLHKTVTFVVRFIRYLSIT